MRNVITIIAALVVLAVVAEAVVIYSGAYYVGADKPHWSITTWLLKQARDRSIRTIERRSSRVFRIMPSTVLSATAHPASSAATWPRGYIHSRRIWLTRLAPIAPASCSGSSSTGSG